MNAQTLKGLWEKRLQTATSLQTLAEVTRGREPTAEETQQEERMGGELVDLDEKIDKGMAEVEREQRSADAFDRYSRLTAGQAQPNVPGDRSQEVADGLRSFLKGETRSWEYNIDGRVAQNYDIEKRQWNPDVWENRALTEATANMPLPKSFSGQLYEVLVDSVGLIRAKQGTDTLFVTQSGEQFTVPKMSDGTAGVVAEGASIAAQSVDPTPGLLTLGAWKVAEIVDLSRELVEDQQFDIVGYTARAVGRAIGRKAGALYVTGTGTNQPKGFITDASLVVAVTGPVGTTTSLGVQATAGMGSDLLVQLLYAVAEPYANNGAWFMARSSIAKVAQLKGSNGEVIWQPGLAPGRPDTLLGYPIYTDPNMPVMAANALPIVFGDFNGYAARIVRGVRFERSDEAKWDTDLVSFRGVLRTDGAMVDYTAIKAFKNSAT